MLTLTHGTHHRYDMDEFTKDFYRKNYDVQDLTPIDVSEPAPVPPVREIPPYTGIGSAEDSYRSVEMIDPKAPSGLKSLLQLLKCVICLEPLQ
jgi:hypothetical protein